MQHMDYIFLMTKLNVKSHFFDKYFPNEAWFNLWNSVSAVIETNVYNIVSCIFL